MSATGLAGAQAAHGADLQVKGTTAQANKAEAGQATEPAVAAATGQAAVTFWLQHVWTSQ